MECSVLRMLLDPSAGERLCFCHLLPSGQSPVLLGREFRRRDMLQSGAIGGGGGIPILARGFDVADQVVAGDLVGSLALHGARDGHGPVRMPVGQLEHDQSALRGEKVRRGLERAAVGVASGVEVLDRRVGFAKSCLWLRRTGLRCRDLGERGNRLGAVSRGHLRAAECVCHLVVVRQRRDSLLGCRQSGSVVAVAQMQVDQHHAWRHGGGIQLDRVAQQRCQLCSAGAGLRSQLGNRHERWEILRIRLQQLVEVLSCLGGLVVAQIERRKARSRREIERVDRQRVRESQSGGTDIVA